MECKMKSNKKQCTCASTSCPRHGICCECIQYHLSTNTLPMCVKDQMGK